MKSIVSKAFIKLPRPGVDVTAGFATIKTNTDLKSYRAFPIKILKILSYIQ